MARQSPGHKSKAMEGRARVEALMLLIPTWGGSKVTEDNCIRGSGVGNREGGVLKTWNGCWRTNDGSFHQDLLNKNFARGVLAVETRLSRRPW